MDFKLFGDDGDKVVMPTETGLALAKEQEQYKTSSVDAEITQDKVGILKISEDMTIAESNYVIDLTSQTSISAFQSRALKSLKSDLAADTTIYLYTAKGLISIGKGNSFKLARMMPLLVGNVLDDSVKVYKDYKKGAKLNQVTRVDITKLSLNL